MYYTYFAHIVKSVVSQRFIVGTVRSCRVPAVKGAFGYLQPQAAERTFSVTKQERELAIIRGAIKCETRGQPDTVRVGMGQDETQEHRFPCRQCKEDIVIHLDVDYQNVAAHIRCGLNSKPIDEATGAPIVNLDANFLISEAEQGQDRIFPRLRQMCEIVKKILSITASSNVKRVRS